jgi:hypothetical protein
VVQERNKMVNRDDIFKHLKTRAEYYKDKDDYSGVFSVAQVLWLIEEIERLRLESNRIDDWKMQRLCDLSSQL